MSTAEQQVPEYDHNELVATYAAAANAQAGRTPGVPALRLPERLTAEQSMQWLQNGYFIVPALVDAERCERINTEAIALTRDLAAHGEKIGTNAIGDTSFLIGESNFSDRDEPRSPEDHASKVYNLHRDGIFHDIARHLEINHLISAVLGPDVDCFNSQFIFKNPGAWGQPWHQDSLYFAFDRGPQVGMWLATSPATPENGCLYVAPGSHTEPVHTHIPDRRPGANLGYLEVVDHDFSGAVPVLMEVGDVLIFHSFLLHKSVDNTSDARRTALVYHYGEAGTRSTSEGGSSTIDWMATTRAGSVI